MQTRNKTRVLIFVDWFFPGFKAGGPIQSCGNLVKSLGHRFDFFVICSDRDFGDKEPYKNIEFDRWQELPDGGKIYYAAKGTYRKNLLRLIRNVNPDVIYFNSMFSVNFTQLPLFVILKNKIRAKLVLAPRGMLQAGALRMKKAKKSVFLKLLKLSGIPSKIHFQATDQQEKEDVERIFPNAASVSIVGNIPSLDSSPPNTTIKEPGAARFIFVSRVQEKKNILFFLDILNEISADNTIVFDIYGNIENADYWRKVESRIKALAGKFEINYKGSIDHSMVLETLSKYHFFVLTTFAENFGHSVFEALKSGTPVLLSNNTPWLNLAGVKAGWDISLENRQGFIDTLNYMLSMDNEEFKLWSQGAQQHALNYFQKSNFEIEYSNLFAV